MKDQPGSPSQPNKTVQSIEQQSTTKGTFSSLFGFARNTLNKTLNMG
jgi:hypothetical protein